LNSCNSHHYEFRNGRFICNKCGHVRYPKHRIKITSIIASICIVIAVGGYFFYQEYIVTGDFEKDSKQISKQAGNVLENTTKLIQPTMQSISNTSSSTVTPVMKSLGNITTQVSDRLYHDPMKDKPVIVIPTLEYKIHDLINQQRDQNGLKPLMFDTRLNLIARSHSDDMASRGYFEHDTPEGLSFSDRYHKAGYSCEKQYGATSNSYMISEGGENIFQNNLYDSKRWTNGYLTFVDWNDMDKIASSTVDGWMNSSGHRHNILTPYYDGEGIGVAISTDDKVYITEDFC